MADVFSVATKLVTGLLDSASKAKRNKEGCELLANLGKKTLEITETLQDRCFHEPSICLGLELVNEALAEAKSSVDKCLEEHYLFSLLNAHNSAELLKQAAGKLEYALSQVPLASLGMTADMVSELNSLKMEFRTARFIDTSHTTHQMRLMTEQLEKLAENNARETEEVKSRIEEMEKMSTIGLNNCKAALETFTQYAHDLLATLRDKKEVNSLERQDQERIAIEKVCESQETQAHESKKCMVHTADNTSEHSMPATLPLAAEKNEIGEGLPDIPQQEDSKVQNWLENADADDSPGSAPSSETHDEPTGTIAQHADQIIERLMPAAGSIQDKRIYRRSSWPEDMTTKLNDNLFSVAQGLVDMTDATLGLAANKNETEIELNKVRQSNTETKAQLEEREAELNELTEHFLQVYQIASDLATDSEEQSIEIRDLKLMYERQKQEIEEQTIQLRDLKIIYERQKQDNEEQSIQLQDLKSKYEMQRQDIEAKDQRIAVLEQKLIGERSFNNASELLRES